MGTQQIQDVRIDNSGCFAHGCVEAALIGAPVQEVVRHVRAVGNWQAYLPHVLEIDVRYDDGQYQEFVMVVASDTGGEPLRVRSIRNCREREFEFFQPEPPAFLRHHGGIWRFSEEDGCCRVVVTHVWNLREDVAAQLFPAAAGESTEDRVARLLAHHSRLTLEAWQRALAAPQADARGTQEEL
jgi:hypothetical protein